jgi:serine/threonine protein kinase
MEGSRKRAVSNDEQEPSRNVKASRGLASSDGVVINHREKSHAICTAASECEEYVAISGKLLSGSENSTLAEGAFGSICRVSDTGGSVGKLVSKEIQLALVVTHGVTVSSLTTECGILRALVHPNVVRYHNTRTVRGDRVFCIIMELIEGHCLASIIGREVPPNETDVVEWSRQIASALEYCHSQGIWHGDLRPDNILLTGTSTPATVKIVGFEPPCLITAKTKAFGVKQSIYYSPERIAGLPYDRRDDTWAVGCILLELVANCR